MIEEGFYITLPCNASRVVYPENRISNYRTRLGKTINLKGPWEVALAEFEYPISWHTFNEEDASFIINCDQKLLQPVAGEHFNVSDGINIHIDNKAQTIPVLRNSLKSGYYEDVPFLLREINASLPPQTHLGYDHIRNKVFLKSSQRISLTFYGKLAVILGVQPGVSIETTPHIHEGQEPRAVTIVYAPYQSDIRGGFYTLYLYTDIIDYQSVGDVFVPLLTTVHIDGEPNKIVSVRYDKPHYVRVNKSTITEITIEVKDDQNQDVRFTYGKVVAKLHFRPVKHHLF